ncbi:MAG: DNA glycosylase, partial [Eubacteriales bacterium]
MIAEFNDNRTVLRGICDFDLTAVFESGQCFRFERTEEGFEGIALGGYLHVCKDADALFLYPCTEQDYNEKWKNYFDLDRDYACLFEGADSVLKESLRCAAGLRILNQPPFETLISFIISANNNEKRIRGIVRRLSETFGIPFLFEGRTFYDFPTPRALAEADMETLSGIGAGYRAPYIRSTAQMIADGFDLEGLRSLGYEQAKRELIRLPG